MARTRKPRPRRRRNARRTRTRKSAQSRFALRRPKASVARSLQPIIETKKYAGYSGPPGTYPAGPQELTLDNIFEMVVPKSYMMMQPVANATVPSSASFEGNDVFSRYLQMKLKVTYPATEHMPTGVQVQPVELIWGWTNPMNLTNYTTPKRQDATRTDITQHAYKSMLEWFDSVDDGMQFKDRERRTFNIVGRKKLFPNNNKQVIDTAWVGVDIHGGAPIIRKNITWKTNKKVEYTKSSDPEASVPFAYPNQAYIPFVGFYSPSIGIYNDAGPPDADNRPTVQYNDCHWFNDA